MVTSGCCWPAGLISATPAPSISCPSRNTVALTGNVSPVTALAGRRPHSRTGWTSRMGIRPITTKRYRVSRGGREGGPGQTSAGQRSSPLGPGPAAEPGHPARLRKSRPAAHVLALLGVPNSDVDLEFSGGVSQARVVDVAADVAVDGGQGAA